MVASEDSDSVLESDLQAHKQCYGLDRVVTTINVVAHKEVIGVGGLSTYLRLAYGCS